MLSNILSVTRWKSYFKLKYFTLYDLAHEYLIYKVMRLKITDVVTNNFERFILILFAGQQILPPQCKVVTELYCLVEVALFLRILTVRSLAGFVICTKQRYCLSY